MRRPFRSGAAELVMCANGCRAPASIRKALRITVALALLLTATPPASHCARVSPDAHRTSARHVSLRMFGVTEARAGSPTASQWKVEDCLRDVRPLSAAPDTLRAELRFGGPEVFQFPAAVRFARDGGLLVLDANNHRVAICDAKGRVLRSIGKRGSGADEFFGPLDFDVEANGAMLVADTGNERFQLRDRDGRTKILPRHYAPRSVCAVGDGAGFLAQADPSGGYLFERVDLEGNVHGGFGENARDPLGRRHVQDALNRTLVARFDDERFVVAFRTLSEIHVYSREGRLLSRFNVRGPGFEQMRCFAYFGLLAPYLEPGRRPEPDPSLDRMTEEVALACSDGMPHGTLYIGGIATHAGRIHVLCNGVVHAFDPGGALLHRYVLRGPDGEALFSHGLAIDAGGRLAAWDSFHTYEVRLFRLPALERAPAQPAWTP